MHSFSKKILTAISCFFLLTPSVARAQVSYQTNGTTEEFETYESISEIEIHDPWEKMNRKIYNFNDTLDRYVVEHVAKFYRDSVPRPARQSIRNFLSNAGLPISALNSLLQGKVDNTLATVSHFLINTTIGLAGFFDVAGEKGIFYKKEDFGQTLGRYGMNYGIYLVIPIAGPSSTRDFTGWVTDKGLGTIGFNHIQIGGSERVKLEYRIALTVFGGIDTRESLIDTIDDIRRESFDPYATVRSAYLQKRDNEIKN
jgi:phospholipid-binding lipoprotein MlaA